MSGGPPSLPPALAGPGVLLARCDTCADRARCRASGGRRAEYPRCHRPVRRTHLGRLAELLCRCADREGIARSRRDALVELVLEKLGCDRERWSEIMELSI